MFGGALTMTDRDTLKPRSEVLAMALPAVVLVLVDWVFWGLRAEQAGFGVNVDGLALLAAFVVALLASGSERATEDPRPGLFDGMLQRFAIASFGLLAASVCGAAFAYIRLSSIWVGPALHSERVSGHTVLMALVLLTAPRCAPRSPARGSST
jgi:hypothetical protein